MSVRIFVEISGEMERIEYRDFAERLVAWLRDELDRMVAGAEGASGGIQSVTEFKTSSQVRAFLSDNPFGPPSPYAHRVEMVGYVSLPPPAEKSGDSHGQVPHG